MLVKEYKGKIRASLTDDPIPDDDADEPEHVEKSKSHREKVLRGIALSTDWKVFCDEIDRLRLQTMEKAFAGKSDKKYEFYKGEVNAYIKIKNIILNNIE